MRVYVLRHGIAEDAPPGASDADRALTPEGKQKLRRVLERARDSGVDPGLILTSPLKRAVETAQIAATVLHVESELVRTNSLLPTGEPERVWKEIRTHKVEELLIAGHEPLLSGVVAFLLGSPVVQVNMKKAALVSIELETAQQQPRGALNWMLTPKVAG